MRIAAIIPAYNEEKTVGNIVQTIGAVDIIEEVIVVSDGSGDNTALNARKAGAKVIELVNNLGKGGAMLKGVESTEAEIVLFLDADLIGLTPNHILKLLTPIILGEVDMTIGIFERGRLATDLAQFVAPYLSGQRAMKRNLLTQISNAEISRYGIEVVLTAYVKRNGIPVKEVQLREMSHIMKEEKLGLLPGLRARMKMYWEIAKCVARN